VARKRKARKPGAEARARDKEKAGIRVSEIPGQVSLERSPFKLRGKIRYLSTDIDSLYTHVLENKSVRLPSAARRFRVSRETIEEWGKILEDHHMIELHYPVAGEPTLRVPRPRGARGKKPREKKEKKPRKPLHLKLTKKRLLIMAEIIILGELFIYIFLVNPHLRENFMPTLNYQLSNLPAHVMNLPSYLSGLLGSLLGREMLINPLYFIIGIIIVVFWMAAALMQKRKKSQQKAKQPK
jgi:hypothetical protein